MTPMTRPPTGGPPPGAPPTGGPPSMRPPNMPMGLHGMMHGNIIHSAFIICSSMNLRILINTIKFLIKAGPPPGMMGRGMPPPIRPPPGGPGAGRGHF